jgi:signal transduction histidine kinase
MQIKAADILGLLRGYGKFLTTPRKIHPIFFALPVYAVWQVNNAYRALNEVPNVSIVDNYYFVFTMAMTIFAFIVPIALSPRVQKVKPRYWVVTYVLILMLSLSPMEIIFYTNDPSVTAVVSFFRFVFLVGITESIAGFLIAQSEARSKELERHQQDLVSSEEEFRQRVLVHLHDNVQSRLVVLGIQLGQLGETLPDASSAKMASLVEELESIRSQEVREFGRGISPNIESEGLVYSLNRLFNLHTAVINCRLSGFEALSLNKSEELKYGLGVYRIVEQALLNSILHGKASEFNVTVSGKDTGWKMEISNNGAIFNPNTATQGHGFAVIDSWSSRLDASWSISSQGTSVVLEVVFR